MEKADAIDKKKADGENVGLLAGLPIAVKDLICEKDVECKCASKILEGYFPTYDATVIENLKNAILNSKNSICAERAVIWTDYYKKSENRELLKENAPKIIEYLDNYYRSIYSRSGIINYHVDERAREIFISLAVDYESACFLIISTILLPIPLTFFRSSILLKLPCSLR